MTNGVLGFPVLGKKSLVRVVVLLQDKESGVQSRASPLVHVWSGIEHFSQRSFKLLSSLFQIVKETEEKFEQPDFSFFL